MELPLEAPQLDHPVLRVELSYDGTRFHGWANQPGVRTVQGELESALAEVARHPVRVFGASRTDAGVHAWGQVASFVWPVQARPQSPFALHRALTALLPSDAAALRLEQLAGPWPGGEPFHARFSARGKRYRYAIWPHRVTHVRLAPWLWTLRGAPDAAGWRRAAEAAEVLLGEHDFAGLRASDCDARSTVRRMDRIAIHHERPAGEPIVIEVEGSAFLKNMVRILVGTLVDIARGTLAADTFARVLATGDRRLAGQTAPACGLTLDELFYPDHPWTQPRWELPPRP